MKRDEQNAQNILDQFLDRFGKPTARQMESAGERVFLQLQRRARSSQEPKQKMDEAIFGSDTSLPFWKPLLLAAAIVLAVAIPATFFRSFVGQNVSAQVLLETPDGTRKIGFGDAVRSNDKTGTMLVLADGSRVEMRSHSELALEQVKDGVRIRLRQGSVIVTAAKQHGGHLYVQTKDLTVSVVGTVFLVNAEETGSRVAVIQGEVLVQDRQPGAVAKTLTPGEQVATNPSLKGLTVTEEIQWSQNASAHLAVLQQALEVVPPHFEVASIRPCPPFNPGGGGGAGGLRGGGGSIPSPTPSPGMLLLKCSPIGSTLEQLIRQAYITFENGHRNPQYAVLTIVMEGLPPWAKTDRYEIDARADGNPSPEMIKGPMLQALLEERFKLRVHRETREIPVYAMTVLRGGLKVQPIEEGSCDDTDTTPRGVKMTPDELQEFLQPGQKPHCRLIAYTSWGPTDANQTVHAKGVSLSQFAGVISKGLDRPVIDKTGIPGLFNFRLQFAKDQAVAGFLPPTRPDLPPANLPETPVGPAAPTIFTAIQEQLGLKLDSSRGPGDFMVIDHVERPLEN